MEITAKSAIHIGKFDNCTGDFQVGIKVGADSMPI